MRAIPLTAILCFPVLFATQLSAGTKEFDDVLHTVEGSCGIHHIRMPFVNMFVNLGMRFSDDEDTKQLKDVHFAVFDLDRNKAPHCPADLQERITRKLGPDWIPFVRVHSREQQEDVVIYMQATEREPKSIVTSVDAGDAVVVQVRFNKQAYVLAQVPGRPPAQARGAQPPEVARKLVRALRRYCKGGWAALIDRRSTPKRQPRRLNHSSNSRLTAMAAPGRGRCIRGGG